MSLTNIQDPRSNNLGPTPDSQGNFTGDPAFKAPRDARPGRDGPAIFFAEADFPLRDRLRFFNIGQGPLLSASQAPELLRRS
jgi:hypothetical protein